MKDENIIQKTASKIAGKVAETINNKSDELKERTAREQAECEYKAKGLSLDEIKNELQYNLYSSDIGKFLVSFCEYIMYVLICIEMITFYGHYSGDYRVVNSSFEAGILEIFIAIFIGIICIIKNKKVPVLIYTLAVSVTYFLRLTERSYYNVLNLGILVLMLSIGIYIIRRFIKSKRTEDDDDNMDSMFENDKYYEDRTQIDTLIRCKKCGNICTKGDKFCGECGEDLNSKEKPYKKNVKSEDDKSSSRSKKSSRKIEDTFDIDKTEFIDRTM
ncbi:MAG: zinc ribbon domain-containing protein, partial [Clostridium sp.]|nr:zinc ribbon domain-containing protein [Clostridium sp.]